MTMANINIPQDRIPIFGDVYLQKLGTPSDFESVNFYSDFTRLINAHSLTTDMQEGIMKFFEISFIPDPALDLLCSEAFKPTTPSKRNASSAKASPANANSAKKAKRDKNYNAPLLRTQCESCADKELRIKLMKKVANCKVDELIKCDNFWGGIKLEKNQLATLPPVNEIDTKLNADLVELMEARINAEYVYLHDDLPTLLNKIKLTWYQNLHSTKEIVFVAETESEGSAWV